VGKPRGVLHPRVQQVGPDHFGIVCFDCAKVRSKFLLADFYGRLLLYMASIKASRLMKSICMARIPKRRLRSEDDMANHLETFGHTNRAAMVIWAVWRVNDLGSPLPPFATVPASWVAHGGYKLCFGRTVPKQQRSNSRPNPHVAPTLCVNRSEVLMAEQTIPFQAEQWMSGPITERSAVRHFPSSQEVYCQPMPASSADGVETGWWGKLCNLSSGGLAVRLSRSFEPGTLLIIELSDKTKRLMRSSLVQVVHAAGEGNRLWIIGCEFIRPLSEEEVQTLVAE
jgi:hypothetical protein